MFTLCTSHGPSQGAKNPHKKIIQHMRHITLIGLDFKYLYNIGTESLVLYVLCTCVHDLATCVVGYKCDRLCVWLATCVVGYMCDHLCV